MCCCIAPAGDTGKERCNGHWRTCDRMGCCCAGPGTKALQVFNESIQYYTQLQQQGMIESFEPVALEPHGGD